RLENSEISDEGLDSLGLAGRGVLRLPDSELEGCRGLLSSSIDAVVVPVAVDSPIDRLLRELSFAMFDEVGTRRDPETGTLLGKDVLFVRARRATATGSSSAAACSARTRPRRGR